MQLWPVPNGTLSPMVRQPETPVSRFHSSEILSSPSWQLLKHSTLGKHTSFCPPAEASISFSGAEQMNPQINMQSNNMTQNIHDFPFAPQFPHVSRELGLTAVKFFTELTPGGVCRAGQRTWQFHHQYPRPATRNQMDISRQISCVASSTGISLRTEFIYLSEGRITSFLMPDFNHS